MYELGEKIAANSFWNNWSMSLKEVFMKTSMASFSVALCRSSSSWRVSVSSCSSWPTAGHSGQWPFVLQLSSRSWPRPGLHSPCRADPHCWWHWRRSAPWSLDLRQRTMVVFTVGRVRKLSILSNSNVVYYQPFILQHLPENLLKMHIFSLCPSLTDLDPPLWQDPQVV